MYASGIHFIRQVSSVSISRRVLCFLWLLMRYWEDLSHSPNLFKEPSLGLNTLTFETFQALAKHYLDTALIFFPRVWFLDNESTNLGVFCNLNRLRNFQIFRSPVVLKHMLISLANNQYRSPDTSWVWHFSIKVMILLNTYCVSCTV